MVQRQPRPSVDIELGHALSGEFFPRGDRREPQTLLRLAVCAFRGGEKGNEKGSVLFSYTPSWATNTNVTAFFGFDREFPALTGIQAIKREKPYDYFRIFNLAHPGEVPLIILETTSFPESTLEIPAAKEIITREAQTFFNKIP